MLNKSKWILAFALALGGLTLFSAAESQACSKYKHSRYRDPRVNTRVESRYDFNHNGYIGWNERYAMNNRRVNTWRERRCDYNYNGVVDAREVSCVY